MDPKFKNGIIGTNTKNFNKQTGTNSIKTLGGALDELAKCSDGGHSKLGYSTFTNLNSVGNDLWLVTIHDGEVKTLIDSSVNRQAIEDCYCGDCTDIDSIFAGLYTPTYTPTYAPTYTPTAAALALESTTVTGEGYNFGAFTYTVNMPATRPDGDTYIAITYCVTGTGSGATTFPAGWSLIATDAIGLNNNTFIHEWTGSSEPATYDIGVVSDYAAHCVIFRVSGGSIEGQVMDGVHVAPTITSPSVVSAASAAIVIRSSYITTGNTDVVTDPAGTTSLENNTTYSVTSDNPVAAVPGAVGTKDFSCPRDSGALTIVIS